MNRTHFGQYYVQYTMYIKKDINGWLVKEVSEHCNVHFLGTRPLEARRYVS